MKNYKLSGTILGPLCYIIIAIGISIGATSHDKTLSLIALIPTLILLLVISMSYGDRYDETNIH